MRLWLGALPCARLQQCLIVVRCGEPSWFEVACISGSELSWFAAADLYAHAFPQVPLSTLPVANFSVVVDALKSLLGLAMVAKRLEDQTWHFLRLIGVGGVFE